MSHGEALAWQQVGMGIGVLVWAILFFVSVQLVGWVRRRLVLIPAGTVPQKLSA